MRILVTRPENAGRETATKLIERGHQPVLLPLSRPIHDPAAAELALRQPNAGVAITSAEALRAIAPLHSRLGPWLAKPVFAVGDATARAARLLGFTDIVTGAGDGESLADTIVEHRRASSIDGTPILYLAGNPRSPRFEDRLAARHVPVILCECYRMEPVAYTADELQRRLGPEPPETVLLYSAENARRFFALLYFEAHAEQLEGMRFLCLGKNILAAIPALFRPKAVAAATPDEAALFALI